MESHRDKDKHHTSRHGDCSGEQGETSIVSKRVSGFDMEPPASGISAGAATTGQVSPPLPTFSGAGMSPSQTGQPSEGVSMMPIQQVACRAYVGPIYPPASKETVTKFFNHVMASVGGNTAGPGDAVVSVDINNEEKFALVEMRSVEEASNAMALDGIVFMGAAVRVKRPSEYDVSLAADLGPSHPNPSLKLAAVGLTNGSSVALEGSHRLFVSGLPDSLSETEIEDLLEKLGDLESFDLTRKSEGIVLCTYEDMNVTDTAIATFNRMKIKCKTVRARRAKPTDGV